MDTTSVYKLPLAEATKFAEWFKIAMTWKVGKNYRWKSPVKEEKVDGSKGELVGLSTPPASPLKPKSPSSFDSSASVRPDSLASSSSDSVPESPPLTPPRLTTRSVVEQPDFKPASESVNISTSWANDLPSCKIPPESPRSPPSPPPEQEFKFENEFFVVRTSPKGGLGCFAKTDIKSGTMIHSEEPLFISSIMQVYYHYEQLTAEQQAAYLKLHCWHGLVNHKIVAIFQTNRFHITGGKSGIFLNSSRFNHACPEFRNCTYAFSKEANKMIFTTMNDISIDQELTISYASVPNCLYQNYGFFCDCPGCPTWDAAYEKWKADDDLRREEDERRGKPVELEVELYGKHDAWEDGVYEW